jgi:hypothetical protein
MPLCSRTSRAALAALCATLPVACADPGGPRAPEDPTLPPGVPRLGAHAIAFHRIGNNPAVIATPAMTTAAAGSTLLVAVGRGDLGAHAVPTDSKSNAPYVQLGAARPYTRWPSSGTAVYAYTGMAGGAGHVVRAATPPGDEVTLAAVEIVEGQRVAAAEWSEVLVGSPLTSRSVTTAGPATLVALWWGDAGVAEDKTATPNNGFRVIESVLASGELVQAAVAVKSVPAAGTYDVTWTATPRQGAQLWLIAVE